MGRSLQKFRENLTNKLNFLLHDKAFADQFKIGRQSFSRNRKLSFVNLMVLLMHPLSKSIQRELDDFFQRLNKSDFQIRTVTKGALTQARAKLQPEAFQALDKVVRNGFYKDASHYTWDKYRVRVVDGSTIVLPQHG